MTIEVVDWPADLVDVITQSSFYPIERVSSSSSIFSADVELQSAGRVWRASVTLQAPQQAKGRRRIEAFLRGLKGGTVRLRLYDFDYQIDGPAGTARGAADALASPPTTVEWTTGARWSTGAGWSFDGTLKAAVPIAPGDTHVWLVGTLPSEDAVCDGDTFAVAGKVALVDQVIWKDAAGRVLIKLDPAHQIVAAIGDPVVIGLPYRVAMRWTNAAAAVNNLSGVDRRPTYQLELVESGYATA